MDLSFSTSCLRNLGDVNVVLGKNGVGKSELLRALDDYLTRHPEKFLSKYISPERAGEFAYHSSVEMNVRSSERWASDTRRRNRVAEFRNLSFWEYRNLEVLALRRENADLRTKKEDWKVQGFNDVLAQINGLLDHVRLERGVRADPEIRSRATADPQRPETMSSGKSELLSLAIEILSFCYQAEHPDCASKQKLLLIDEPDVHLHPDLQVRFVALISEAAKKRNIVTIIATHSTEILAGLTTISDRVAFMTKGADTLNFRAVSDQLDRIIPVFGAHPLTNVFNERPILLLEGEDDELIWQKAVRSSCGLIKLYPCSVETVAQLHSHETEAAEIIAAVYDNGKGYSLRDGDGIEEELNDVGCIVRLRLKCRAAENLMLTDDVLELAQTDWSSLLKDINKFVDGGASHAKLRELKAFLDGGAQRRTANLKEIRLLISGLFTNKPWEIIVGQAIARLARGEVKHGADTLYSYIGEKACKHLLGLTIPVLPQ